MAAPNLEEITTTTLKRRTRRLADNVTNHNALLRHLRKTPEPGGETIVKELEYAENDTFKWYSGYEALDLTPQEVISAAEYDWKQAAVSIMISGLEMRKNSGPDRMINLLESRIRNAERTMMNQLNTALAGDGTGSGGKEIGGLQLLIADDPTTGTVGGIDRATWTFWRNNEVDASGTPADETNIQGYMADAWLEAQRGMDKPKLIIGSSDYFRFYWDSLVAIQRIVQPERGASGFETLTFYGPGGRAPVHYDDAIPANKMYFINTDFMFWQPHRDADMTVLGEQRSLNQDALVRHILWMGALTMSNAAVQCVIHE